MITYRELQALVHNILAQSKADASEVLILAEESQLTRFANSAIHQNVSETNVQVRVRAIVGRRQGVAVTNDIGRDSLARVVEQATLAARHLPPRETEIPLAGPAEVIPVASFSEATAGCSPRRRAEAVGVVCQLADERNLSASGAFNTATFSVAYANSLGAFAYHLGTQSIFTTVVMGHDSSGFAGDAHWDLDAIDTESLGREAVETALRSRAPRPFPAGEYPVVLKPYAMCDIIGTLGWMGMGALSMQEKRSFLVGRLGTRVASPLVTIWDDARDLRGLPMPFDYEGVPAQKVVLIEKGIARDVVYDLETAQREGRTSTGHGLPAPNTWGPMPTHLFMEAGQATLEELVSGLDRGLLVTRFHYTVPVHEQRTVTTGMTRDGTFWVEGGEIAYPVKNLRFTQSYIGALEEVEAIGRDVRLLTEWSGGNCAPAARIRLFRFTGETEF